jgi:multidrug transporter EmrE-like cation transporter
MAAVSPTIIGLVLLSALAQVAGLTMMPASKGLTEPWPTLGLAQGFIEGIGILARISNMGVNLSLLIPFVAALVPLGAVAVGVFLYGEPASFAKIGILVTACVLVGVANMV